MSRSVASSDAVPRPARGTAGRYALRAVLLAGVLPALGFLLGGQAHAAEGPTSPARPTRQAAADAAGVLSAPRALADRLPIPAVRAGQVRGADGAVAAARDERTGVTERTRATRPAEVTRPTEVAGSAQAANNLPEVASPAEAAGSAEVAKALPEVTNLPEATNSAEVTNLPVVASPAEAARSAEVAKALPEVANPAEVTNLPVVASPAEAVRSAEFAKVLPEVTNPAEVANPAEVTNLPVVGSPAEAAKAADATGYGAAASDGTRGVPGGGATGSRTLATLRKASDPAPVPHLPSVASVVPSTPASFLRSAPVDLGPVDLGPEGLGLVDLGAVDSGVGLVDGTVRSVVEAVRRTTAATVTGEPLLPVLVRSVQVLVLPVLAAVEGPLPPLPVLPAPPSGADATNPSRVESAAPPRGARVEWPGAAGAVRGARPEAVAGGAAAPNGSPAAVPAAVPTVPATYGPVPAGVRSGNAVAKPRPDGAGAGRAGARRPHPSGESGDAGGRSALDDTAQRHAPVPAVAPDRGTIRRLGRGVPAATTTGATRDRNRDVPLFPG